MKRTSFAVMALSLLATPLAAESIITVDDPRAFATPATAMAGGAFVTLTNSGTTDDTLIAVQADFPRVEIHTTEFDGDIARMVNIGRIDIPAGESVSLKPGGLHIMFMGLRDNPLVKGGTVPATLVFEHAGEIEVSFDIVPRTMQGHGHNHGHSHDHDADHDHNHDH